MQEKSGLGRVDQIAIIERVTRSQRSDLHRLIQSRCCLEKHCLVLSVGNSILWVTPKEHVPCQKFHGSKKYLPSEIIGLWLLWHHFEDGGMKTFWYPPIQHRSAGSQPTLRQMSEPSGKPPAPPRINCSRLSKPIAVLRGELGCLITKCSEGTTHQLVIPLTGSSWVHLHPRHGTGLWKFSNND